MKDNIFDLNKKDILTIFANRLKELMNFQSLSISQLSQKINIPKSTINCWLLKIRSPQIDSLVAIADYFGVTTDYLLGREDI